MNDETFVLVSRQTEPALCEVQLWLFLWNRKQNQPDDHKHWAVCTVLFYLHCSTTAPAPVQNHQPPHCETSSILWRFVLHTDDQRYEGRLVSQFVPAGHVPYQCTVNKYYRSCSTSTPSTSGQRGARKLEFGVNTFWRFSRWTGSAGGGADLFILKHTAGVLSSTTCSTVVVKTVSVEVCQWSRFWCF